ncbi:MAG TPA: mannonate dehydratase [Thermoflexales bacterium]|nr:mannonate dehydratase [Thermoflexales bacterium]
MNDINSLPMRIAIGQVNELTDEFLTFAAQLGLADVQMNLYNLPPGLPDTGRLEFQDLLKLRSRAEERGLRLICIENVPVRFYNKIMLGQDGREQQLANMQETVRNLGRAGIPIFGYHFIATGVWRTGWDTPVRGGAISNSFKMELAAKAPLSYDREYHEDEMWANYDWYLERLLPVAEEYGVRLALHPDDPPVPKLGGVPRLFRNFENFKRAMDTHASPMHGLDFCHGCWSEMRSGAGVIDAIQHFGKRIFYVHMRDVQGGGDEFTECFIDEGNSNILHVMRALKDTGFNGFIIDDHVPHLVNDTPYGHRGRAYATGYLRAMLDAVNG